MRCTPKAALSEREEKQMAADERRLNADKNAFCVIRVQSAFIGGPLTIFQCDNCRIADVSNPTDFLRRAGVTMLDLKLGDELLFDTPVAFLLQTDLWEMVQHNGPAGMAVLGILICFSLYSWTIIFSKLGSLRGAGKANSRFLRAFRKASGM